ncbi:MAG TPA: glycosyltransferase 87 family protein [Candidatus Sulfotelmatobacter sp.]|nr:glycosyltransferase 87 family protein [Candidatus Sulfotelmatobacter sp.]
MATSQFGTRPLAPALALFLALTAAGAMVYYHLGFFIPSVLQNRALHGGGSGYSFGDDLYPVWLTTRQWRAQHLDLYGTEMTREIQTGLFGRPLDARNPNDPATDYRQFAYPAFTDLILWPTSVVEFPKLRLVLAILLPLLTAVSIKFWILALDWRIRPVWLAAIVLLGLCNYELLEAFFAEQPGLLVGFFMASAALALRRNRLMLAGMLMSLTLIKPQMTLLATLYMLLWSVSDRRRARFWIGFFSVTIFMTVASLLIWPYWIKEWIGILLGYHRYAMPPLISVLLGPALNAVAGRAIIALSLVASGALAWKNRGASPETEKFWLTLSLLLAVTTVAILPGQAIYDHVVLFPGIFLLIKNRREFLSAGKIPRTLLMAGTLVLFWPWISAAGLLIVHRWLMPNIFGSTAIFVLPIRTAASLPFAVLALLAWSWRLRLASNQAPA